MALTDVSTPALGEVAIRVTYKGTTRQFDRFLSYEYNEDYLSPSDSGSFELAEKELQNEDLAVLQLGATVQVLVGGNLQSTGILDEFESNVERSSGTVVRMEYRDAMSPAVDGQIDPKTRFVDTQTLADVVETVFGQFGFTNFVVDNEANRNIITGRTHGTPTSKKGKPLKSYTLYREKPRPMEGAYAFASRISQRFGLWIRPGADGKTIVIAKPDFDQEPRYGLQHTYDATATANNIERGHFKKSRREQPSVLYASGFGSGGQFDKSRLRSGIVNPVVDADNSALINAYKNVKFASVPPVTAAFPPLAESSARAAFLFDNESHTQAQLDAFVLRELSLRMRKALAARYEFMGHKLNGQTISIDTIMSLNDQRPTVKWAGPLWILGKRFSKTPTAGTRTVVEMLLPGSLVF